MFPDVSHWKHQKARGSVTFSGGGGGGVGGMGTKQNIDLKLVNLSYIPIFKKH